MTPIYRTRSMLALFLLVLLQGGASFIASAAEPDAPAPEAVEDSTFEDEADVIAVEVPVQVVHKGRPVLGLRERDFRILDEGVRRPITSFEVIERRHDLAGGPADGPAAAPTAVGAERRHFLLLFDLAFTRPHELSRAERAARDLLDGGLEPSDLVGVAFYSPRGGANLLVNFTSDRSQVRRVLDGLRQILDGSGPPRVDPGAADGRRDPLGLTAGTSEAVLAEIGAAAGVEVTLAEDAIDAGLINGSGGRRGLGALELEKVVNMMWAGEQGVQDRRAGWVADLSKSLATLAQQTAGIRGSKYLVFLSSGFDADLLRTRVESGPNHPTKSAHYSSGGGSWVALEVLAMVDEMRRAGWILHAVDLGGTAAAASFTEGLFYLARGTGGTVYENANDPAAALRDLVAATSVTYLLTFTVDELPAEPDFRELEVKVSGAPRGARVSHRSGYHTPRAWQELSSGERRADTLSLLFSGSDQDPIGSRLSALAFRRPEGGAGIAVVLDLDGQGLAVGPQDQPAGADIYGYAFDAEGRVADFFAHRVDVAGDEARELLASGGLRFLGDLDVAAGGRYQVRIVARSLRNGSASVLTTELDLAEPAAVPEAEPAGLMAGADREGGWLVVREVGLE